MPAYNGRVIPPVPVFDLSAIPEKDRDRVGKLIPDPRHHEGYVHRTINGIFDYYYLDAAIADGDNILLSGPTGSSKSTLFRAYCAFRRLPLAIIESNASMDLSTVLGRVDPNTLEWVDGTFTLVARYGGVGVAEEFNMINPRMGAGFHQLFSVARQLELPENSESIKAGRGHQTPQEVEMDDGSIALMYLEPPQPTLFAANINPRNSGYAGTQRMNDATLNRFGMPIPWDYLHEVEEQLLDSAKLLEIGENLRTLEDILSPVSTNALMELERHWWRFGWVPALELFIGRFQDEEQGSIRRAFHGEHENIVRELEAAEQKRADDAATVNAMATEYVPVKKASTRRRTTRTKS